MRRTTMTSSRRILINKLSTWAEIQIRRSVTSRRLKLFIKALGPISPVPPPPSLPAIIKLGHMMANGRSLMLLAMATAKSTASRMGILTRGNSSTLFRRQQINNAAEILRSTHARFNPMPACVSRRRPLPSYPTNDRTESISVSKMVARLSVITTESNRSPAV